MKKIINFTVILLLLSNLSLASISSEKRLDLTFNTTLSNTFNILERELGINIIVDSSIRNQRIDLRANNMTVENIFKLIFQMNSLEYKEIDRDTYFIFPANKAAEYNAEVTRSYSLNYVDAQLLGSLIRSSLKIQNVFVNPNENTLTVKAPRSRMREVDALIEQMEDSSNYFEETYTLSYIGAEKALEAINGITRLSSSSLDDERSRISIRGRQQDRRRIEDLIRRIDVQSPQVVIDVTVLDVSEGFQEEIGFDFDSTFELNSDTSASILYKIINPQLLTLSKTSSNAEILSNPSIMAVNREEASINIGERVPIITARDLGESSGGYDVVPEVEYVDVGIILQIRPDIHRDNEVSIDVALEVSSIGTYQETDYGIYPSFLSKNIDTRIRLRDGEGVAFGGLISSEERENITSVPFFGDLPGLGRLFRKTTTEPRKSEIMMFITPTIIYPEEERDVVI